MTDFVNGLKSLSGLLVLTPEQSDFLHDAAEEMARLGGVGVAQGTGEDDLTAADPGTITRNLRGLASRMEYRVEAIEQRDGNGAGAIQGRGIGIGYLLAKDLANALTEAATYIEGLRAVKPPELTEGSR